MLEKAIEKIRDEMAANADHGYIQHVGGYVTTHLRNHPEDAEAVLAEEKTLKGSYKVMQKFAKEHADHGCYAMPPEEGYKIVGEYFGFGNTESKSAGVCGINLGLDTLLDD